VELNERTDFFTLDNESRENSVSFLGETLVVLFSITSYISSELWCACVMANKTL